MDPTQLLEKLVTTVTRIKIVVTSKNRIYIFGQDPLFFLTFQPQEEEDYMRSRTFCSRTAQGIYRLQSLNKYYKKLLLASASYLCLKEKIGLDIAQLAKYLIPSTV